MNRYAHETNSIGLLRLRLIHFLHFEAKFRPRMERTELADGLSDHFKMWPLSSIVRLEFGRPADGDGPTDQTWPDPQDGPTTGLFILDESFRRKEFVS